MLHLLIWLHYKLLAVSVQDRPLRDHTQEFVPASALEELYNLILDAGLSRIKNLGSSIKSYFGYGLSAID